MKWRKLAYALTGALFTLILSFSWISWADNEPTDNNTTNKTNVNSNPADASNKAGEISFLDYANKRVIIFDGKQKYTYQLSEQTQVLINEKQGDLQQIELGAHAEVIQNSAGEVRYLRVEQKNVQAASAYPSSNTTSKTSSSVKPISTKQTGKSNQMDFPWEKWKLDLHQGNIKVKLEWEGNKAEVEWKTSGRELKLEGDQAKEFIQSWYETSNLSNQKDQEQLVYSILQSFDVQTDKPFSCTIEWKQNGKSGKWTVHPKDHDKDEEKGKEKHKKEDD